jgi:hypothetical protein
MTQPPDVPLLVHPPATPADTADPFVERLIEIAQRNLARPGAATAVVPIQASTLVAAGGWCAPFDPDYVPPACPQPSVPNLACGCPEAILETGQHEVGCTVLEVRTATAGT